ncbi:AbfB domain-containing protein [Streptomyces albicerus]|uniref:AbfB domain-containing protein n=1 Tax=Streptomyces albicerus TaxID=2569859 RepID=UPI00124B8751|nr:AbfB domain-containing protein [Streptomyces albicerus]
MPEKKPGSAPDPSTRPPKVWETGETLDESRIPGTRRLWLAGAALVAVLASTVTAVTVLENGPDTSSEDRKENTTSAADEPVVPTPPPATAPSGKSGLASPEPSGASADAATSPEDQQGGAEPDSVPRPSKPGSADKPPASTPSSSRKSVQAVNYPDRYWHLGDDTVRLDQVNSGSSAETRRESSFELVPGLADSSCVSFSLGGGRYLRHYQFRLRADGHNGSELFKQDATFCPRPSAFSDAVMLEAVNYRGRFLRHRNFQLRLEPFENSGLYRADSAFRLVKGLG